VNVTFVPAIAGVAPVAAVPTPPVAAAPVATAKADPPVAVQAPPPVASPVVASTDTPTPAPAPSPILVAAVSTPKPPPGTWIATLHWIPSPPSPRFGGTGESIAPYDVALTNVSVDANKLSISSDNSNIIGNVAGGTIKLDGWYKDPWGSVNSVEGSLTGSGSAFKGEETCYNTQLAASAPTFQMTRHYCNVELTQAQ
jgi:hypothetical protein